MASEVIICPGACNSAYRRRKALHDADVAAYAKALEGRAAALEAGAYAGPVPEAPAPLGLHPWYGDPVWCLKCKGIIHAELLELDDLAALIAAIPPLARPADDGAGKVGGTRGRLSPSARFDDLDELDEWLRSWEAVARGKDDVIPRRGELARSSTTIIAWLYHHFGDLMGNEDVALDFGEEIRRWRRDLARRAAAGQMSRHQKRPCPRCKLYTLWATVGEDYVKCVNQDCNRMLTREEYESLAA